MWAWKLKWTDSSEYYQQRTKTSLTLLVCSLKLPNFLTWGTMKLMWCRDFPTQTSQSTEHHNFLVSEIILTNTHKQHVSPHVRIKKKNRHILLLFKLHHLLSTCCYYHQPIRNYHNQKSLYKEQTLVKFNWITHSLRRPKTTYLQIIMIIQLIAVTSSMKHSVTLLPPYSCRYFCNHFSATLRLWMEDEPYLPRSSTKKL